MTVQTIDLSGAAYVVRGMIAVIQQNRDYLSRIDAAIGDGDHGINMSKGFGQCAKRLDSDGCNDLPGALDALAETLLDGIGGSMGPLYGSFFMSFAEALRGQPQLDAPRFGAALRAGLEAVQSLGDAKVGDKTLIDTLVPAEAAFSGAVDDGKDFRAALAAMKSAAEQGKESTRNLQARIGRAARLGERSIGELDAGATSCYLLLASIADSIDARLG